MARSLVPQNYESSRMDNIFKWHGEALGSALPTLLDKAAGARALAELLEAADDMKRLMAT